MPNKSSNNKTLINTILAGLLLFIATCIWGYAFVMQKQGMEVIGAFWLTAWRFLLGGVVLIPFVLFESRQTKYCYKDIVYIVKSSLLLGFLLTGGSNFQQIALSFTSVASSGFITSMYVVIIPIIAFLIWGVKVSLLTWIGISLTVLGLFLISITSDFTINYGDLLTLICAVFWALHVIFVGFCVKKISPFLLASAQFLVCSGLSFGLAFLFDRNSFELSMLWQVKHELLYLGILAVGVGYTVQIIGQKFISAVPAAIILSLEAVTASIAGWYFLGEIFTLRNWIGCSLMLLGCLIAQLAPFIRRKKSINPTVKQLPQ